MPLTGPEAAHDAVTEAEYRFKHRRAIRRKRRKDPVTKKIKALEPWAFILTPPTAYVSHGRWVVDCPVCGNGPSVLVPARLALCFGCGAVFENVVVPSEDDIDDIEMLLDARPPQNRSWLAHKGETVADLDDENHAHSLPGQAALRAQQGKPPRPVQGRRLIGG